MNILVTGGLGKVVADDSNVAEPLCDLLPRLRPSIGDNASALTGTQAAYANSRAKKLLGWRPQFSWRI